MDGTTRDVTSRRRFLRFGAGATAGIASWLALGKPPAFAQKRELTFLSWNHFVPASDDELRRQAEVFSKQAGATVRVDTIAHLQLPAKRAAEVASQSGHDLLMVAGADPFLYENHLVDMADVIDELGKRYGGWYSFAAESAQTKSGWRAMPWFWISFPGTYNQAHFKKAGVEPPKTWADLLAAGKVLKKQGNPVGIAISHCVDATVTFGAVLWCHGGKMLEPDGKTPAIVSDNTAQVIEWYKELYRDAMEPEVLSWDDASNNRFILSGKGSWIHNPISPYNSALANKQPIADDLNHHNTPAGPAGRHAAAPILALGVWKFSKNAPLAKEFIRFLFQKENYDAFIVAANAFNHPPLKDLADHPIWASNPKFAMLPKEAESIHPPGWPAKPSDAVQRIGVNYVMPDMVAKAVNGMPAKRAMEWAQDQIVQAVKGQLKAAGSG
jgi:multiple sugar transport system substrate-binding protein